MTYEAECNALESMKETLEGGGFCHYIGTAWDCEKSPIGLCVYDSMKDRAHDHCVFCHGPEERK